MGRLNTLRPLRAVLLAWLGVAPFAAQAYNPDGSGRLALSAGVGFAREVQSGSFKSGTTTYNPVYQDLGSSKLGASLTLGLLDSLSLSGSLGTGSGKYQETVKASNSFTSGKVEDDINSKYSNFGAGLCLFVGSFFQDDFDLDSNANPSGQLYWPQLTLWYYRSNSAMDVKASNASGGFTGYSFSFNSQLQSESMDLDLKVPLATWMSLGAGYGRDGFRNYKSDSNGSSGTRSTSFSDNGRIEAYSLSAEFFLNFFNAAQEAQAPDYFPGAGRVGVPSLQLSYAWGNDLKDGDAALHQASLAAQVPVAKNFALGASYSIGLEGTGPYDDIPGFSESARNATVQTLSIGLALGFGANGWFASGQPTWESVARVEKVETEEEKEEREEKEELRKEVKQEKKY